MKEVITIVGARPQFIKASVVSRALNDRGIGETIIHTGQHYDEAMSSIFWKELNIPAPSVNLDVGSASHGEQTGKILMKLEDFLNDRPALPDGLIVYGDTNSTLAGTLAASKLHIPVVHVESGLRSYNRKMPEEINRVVTDHIATILFCSSNVSVENLKKEGITQGVYEVGDVMFDALLTFSEIAEQRYELNEIIPFAAGEYYLATVHRPSNTDVDEHLTNILEAFNSLDKPVVWPIHPRLDHKISTTDIPDNIFAMEPVSYFQMLILLNNCRRVLTDSGGLQKEAYWMQKPCITLRKETEWVETLEGNWNILTGPDRNKITEAANLDPTTEWKPLYGDGNASGKISDIIADY